MFTGCENFLKAQEVKEEILSAIEYNNAPSYTILVEALNRDVGVIKTPVTGQVSQKVTDTFTVKFEPDSKYTFMKWQAVIEGMAAGETTEDYIEFEDPQSLETKVKFKKAPPSVISLRPVCPENLTVSFNLSDAAEIYPCDSTIQLSFNKPIAAACKDKVLVRIPDIPEARTALSYFKPSQLQNKDLTLFADVSEDDYSNLIPVTASGKIISVILNASDFYYENTDYGETIPIYLKNDITFSYSINSNTTKKSTIKYVVPANIASVGLLRVDEDDARTQSYRVGKEINLKYILQNDDYAFKGWSFAYASTDAENAVFEPVAIQDIKKNLNIDIKYENNEDTLGYDALTKTAQATITVYNYKEGIISVSPVVGSISKTQIATTDPSETGVGEFKVNGVTASDNIIEYRPGQTLVLKYKLTKYDDYRFLGWSAKRTYIDTDGTHTQTYTIDDFTAENLANFNLSFEYDEDSESNGYDSLSRTAKVTVTIDDYIDGQITISPVVWSISKTQIITTDPSETGVGEFKVNGVTASDNIIEYRPGQTLVLKYKLTKYEDYRFLGWSAKRTYVNTEGTQTQTYNLEQFTPQNLSNFKLSVSYEDNADTWGYDSLTRNAVLTLTVADYIDGEITISPVVQKIPTADIYIDGANGKLNPAKGNHSTKQNQINTISFEPDGDYEFLHWQVYDTNTNQPLNYTDYLEITDVNKSETTCKLLAVPSETLNIKIGLRAVVTERPQVISATPSYTATGAYRDSRIQVVFDKDIDEKSIYYDAKEEIPAIQATLVATNGDMLLAVDESDPDTKYYGYVKDNKIFYKNIKIQNNRNLDENLLKYFDPPFLENSKTLIIPTKLTQYPVGGTTLLVTLDKNFSTFEQGKSVGLREAKKWIYFVNSKTDTDPPEISEVKILTGAGIELEADTDSNDTWVGNTQKLKFLISATDTGNGLASDFYMVFDDVPANYPASATNKKIRFESVEGAFATCGGEAEAGDQNVHGGKRYYEVDLAKNSYYLIQGKYKFHLEFFDNSSKANSNSGDFIQNRGNGVKYGLTTTHTNPIYYYLNVDRYNPDVWIDADTIKTDSNAKNRIDLKLQNFDVPNDVQNATLPDSGYDNNAIEIYYRPCVLDTSSPEWEDWTGATKLTVDNTNVTGPVTKTLDTNSHGTITTDVYTVTKSITDLARNTAYEFKVVIYDKAGNSRTYYLKKYTYPLIEELDFSKFNYKVDEVARGIEITASEYPQGLNGLNIALKTTDNTVINQENSYSTTSDPKWFIRGIDYASKYNISFVPSLKETIPTQYSNYNYKQEFINEVTSETPNAFTNVITKPYAKIESYGCTDAYNTSTNKCKMKFYYTKPTGATGVKISYAPYNSDGSLGTYQSVTTAANLTITNPLNIDNLEPGTKYNFMFQTYYDSEDNLSAIGNSVISDKYTSLPLLLSYPTVKIQGNTVSYTWKKSNDDVDFDYYRLEMTKDTQPYRTFEIDKNATGCTIIGLPVESSPYSIKGSLTAVKGEFASNTISLSTSDTIRSAFPQSIATSYIYSCEIKNCTDNSVTLSWKPNNSTDYYLFYSTSYEALKPTTSYNSNVRYVDCSGTANSVTNTTISNLTSHTEYFFGFKNSYRYDADFCSDIFSITTLPDQNSNAANYYVTNFKVSSSEQTSVKLEWTNPVNTSWTQMEILYRDLSSSGNNFITAKTISKTSNPTTSTYLYDLEPGTMYAFKIKTNLNYPTLVSGATRNRSVRIPDGRIISDYGSNDVTMSWEPRGGCNYYLVKKGDNLIARVPYGANTVIDVGLSPNTQYPETYYYVYACNSNKDYYYGAAGSSSYISSFYTRYESVKNFRVSDTDTSETQVKLEWGKPDTSCKNGFEIYYKQDNSATWTKWNETISQGATLRYITNLSPGTKYNFKIITKGDYNSGVYNDSKPVIISGYTKPKEITGYGGTNCQAGATTIYLSWKKPTSNFSTINLKYKKKDDSNWIDVDTYQPKESYSTYIDNLERNTEYYIVWIVYNGMDNNSGSSNTVLTLKTR